MIYVLIDIVANHCYLNSSYVIHISLNVAKIEMLRYGLKVEFEGTISVHVKIQQYQFQILCLVTKISDGFDLI